MSSFKNPRFKKIKATAVFEALEKAYFSYGLTMEIPEGIPLRACYRTAK